jgi:hypothetical protein
MTDEKTINRIASSSVAMQEKNSKWSSAGKAMASVFWKSEGILLVEFLERDAVIKSQRYVQILQKLK